MCEGTKAWHSGLLEALAFVRTLSYAAAMSRSVSVLCSLMLCVVSHLLFINMCFYELGLVTAKYITVERD